MLIDNPNFLARHRFRFLLTRAPAVNYFCQEASVPGILVGNATQPTPILDLPVPGGKVEFEDLPISFAVDEDLQNYLELFEWIVGIGSATSTDQYADILHSQFGLVSDITLMILDSAQNSKHSFVFHNAFPRSLSRLDFNSKVEDAEPVYASAIFKYTHFSVDGINAG